ncbi:Arm DNA-binding domain-containing protein [Daejeonella oryzae]|uniref:Arm DNA-binding domain-containing protein n=1 Tax=Daejeonella oryzae TaxID=1122943 RepID=UPI0004240250|nr:Arm DNA-binding domain-containing protein [Daejeonella oryzae]
MEPVKQFTIYLFLKKSQIDCQGKGPLYAKIIRPGQKPFEFSTRLLIPSVLWDQKKQQVKQRLKNQMLYQQVEDLITRIEKTHKNLLGITCLYKQTTFVQTLNGKITPNPRITPPSSDWKNPISGSLCWEKDIAW